jgi:hypothetical protein
LEAHDANEHLRSHREIVNVGGVPRLAALSSISSTGTMQFGGLLLPSLEEGADVQPKKRRLCASG